MNYWQGAKIRLRAIEPSDAETFHRWNLDSERARQLDFVWPPTSLALSQSWTAEAAKRKLDDGAFHWVIENCQGEPVGTISTHDCEPRNGSFSYGVDVAEEHRGRGYAAEGILIVLRYYFEELRYHKAAVGIHSYNAASIRLHEKLGFVLEGRMREAVYTYGQYFDLLWFGMTANEYRMRWGCSDRETGET
jgi:RimJ/RimL family protein N-acetyltransferase